MQKDFITVSPNSGVGSQQMTVTVAANIGNARSSAIMVSAAGMTRTISISQAKGTALFIVCGNNGYIDKIEV